MGWRGDRLRAGFDQFIGRAREARLVEWDEHLAVGPDALGDLAAEAPGREEGRRLRIEREVVHLVPHLPADLDHVEEAAGGDEADARALALQHRVGGDGGAVHEAGNRSGREPPLRLHALERREHRAARVGAGRGYFQDAGRRAGRAHHHVGEGAADVDADRDPAVRAHSAARRGSSSSK